MNMNMNTNMKNIAPAKIKKAPSTLQLALPPGGHEGADGRTMNQASECDPPRDPPDETVEIHGTFLCPHDCALGGLRLPETYFSWYKNNAESTYTVCSLSREMEFSGDLVAFFALFHHDREAW
jgi:hypothetical protein